MEKIITALLLLTVTPAFAANIDTQYASDGVEVHVKKNH